MPPCRLHPPSRAVQRATGGIWTNLMVFEQSLATLGYDEVFSTDDGGRASTPLG